VSAPAVAPKVAVIVCDSLGVGAAPDADAYGDQGTNTLAHTAAAVGGLHLPTLGAWGIGQLTKVAGVPPADPPLGVVARMAERSAGKDTTTGHWEMMGVILERPFPTYPHGFPAEVIEPFEQAIGRRVLGNRPASGTEIIKELGEAHLASGGDPIVYTSADSVFQIAAHKRVVPLERLYEWCEIARKLLTGPHAVGRVIARPFDGEPGSFSRTTERRDYALPPAGPTVLEALERHGVRTLGVGKIEDIFSRRGLAGSDHTGDNASSLDATVRFLRGADPAEPTFVFTNLVDFDMLYGHRRDAPGYAAALEALDQRLPEVCDALGPDGWVFVTADHGCDPTALGSDHTREYVPMVAYRPRGTARARLADRATFADLGATVAELFGVRLSAGRGDAGHGGTAAAGPGRSFAADLT
jgi:phosphopentomutase